MNLFVSLPRNDIQLAKAALRAGAHGVKVHLNAFHRASGTTFGTFEQEKPFLMELAQLPGHKYVMAGQEVVPSLDEMKALYRLGFEGFNLYLKHAKEHLFQSPLRPILAVDHGYTPEDLKTLLARPDAWIEASIADFSEYGTPLTESDLKAYASLKEMSGRQIIVPSQKKLTPADLPALKKAGVDSILLGVIVTGSTAESIETAIRSFAEALK